MENNICGPQYCPQNVKKMAKTPKNVQTWRVRPHTSAKHTLDIKLTDSKTTHFSSMVLLKSIHIFITNHINLLNTLSTNPSPVFSDSVYLSATH